MTTRCAITPDGWSEVVREVRSRPRFRARGRSGTRVCGLTRIDQDGEALRLSCRGAAPGWRDRVEAASLIVVQRGPRRIGRPTEVALEEPL
ncbi:MAG TPA: hypothetical protein VM076_06090 [Gemmatimonadaceae bacterium]|nr:hypothetical protein [Gemmatimonadaceae bacterium]